MGGVFVDKNEKTKDLSEEQFRTLCENVLPHINAITAALNDINCSDLASFAVGSDGYFSFNIVQSEWSMSRLSKGKEPHMRRDYSEPITLLERKMCHYRLLDYDVCDDSDGWTVNDVREYRDNVPVPEDASDEEIVNILIGIYYIPFCERNDILLVYDGKRHIEIVRESDEYPIGRLEMIGFLL